MCLESAFSLKSPCGNCPFRNDSNAIELADGRLQGIVDDLSQNDDTVFHCHKSVHSKHGGEWDDETGLYHASGKEHVCRGALIYMHKQKRLPILARIAIVQGALDLNELNAQASLVIDNV